MQVVGRPTIDAAALYRDVSSRRVQPRRSRLMDAEAGVLAAYGAYDAALPEVTALNHAETPPATEDDLQSNYTYLVTGAKLVYDALLTLAPHGRCPYCAQGRVSGLDHYLPKEEFPEFSILPVNLLPSCHSCNLNKRGTYREQHRLFMNCYSDTWIDEHRFLFADVTVAAETVLVTFRVDPPQELSVAQRATVRTHFQRLELAQ